MTMIPAFGPWTEHPADTDEEKRLASAQQSKTSPLSVDKERETGVFYGSFRRGTECNQRYAVLHQ